MSKQKSKKPVKKKSTKRISSNFYDLKESGPNRSRPNNKRPRTHKKKVLKITEAGERNAAFLTALFVGLTLFGLVALLSASSVSGQHTSGDPFLLFRRQAIWAALGGVCFLVSSRIDYRILRRFVLPGLGLAVLLLLFGLIPGIGINRGGANRWIQLGPVEMQPAEFAKLALIVFVAHLLALRERRMDRAELTVKPVMVVYLVFAGLLIFQPNISTTVIMGFSVVVLLFVAGARVTHMLPWLGFILVGFVFTIIVSDHARNRFEAFLDPSADTQATKYQLEQSRLGVANGGITGVGWGASRSKWGDLPEPESDSIFVIIAEEGGLITASALIAAYLLVAWYALKAALAAPDRFGMLLAVGLSCWLVSQAFINIGVNLGVFPTTGVPLPFISAGGSSLVMALIAAGLITNIASKAKVNV